MLNKLEITSDDDLRALAKKHESLPLGIESHAILYGVEREFNRRDGKFDPESIKEQMDEIRSRSSRLASDLDCARRERDRLRKENKELKQQLEIKPELNLESKPA